jgi:hypothetical protein
MKYVVAGLVAVLFAGSAFAQTAPQPAAPAPQADQAAPAAEGAQAPTVPVQSKKGTNTTSIVLGTVGAAALLGAASHGGDSKKPAPAPVIVKPTPAPSSP